MHQSSQDRMAEFVEAHIPDAPLDILEVGSPDIIHSYRHHFKRTAWDYTCLDMVPGPNVDIQITSHDDWRLPKQYDVVVCGQVLEHVRDTHKFMKNIYHATKPGGIVFITAPWSWEEHKTPQCPDCWRILPDGMKFLMTEICSFEVIRIWIEHTECIGIARRKQLWEA